jgi:phosphatidylglycerophosphate synthase
MMHPDDPVNQSIRSAILWAGPVQSATGEAAPAGIGPAWREIGGLPVALRLAIQLARAGVDELLVVGGPRAAEMASRMSADERLSRVRVSATIAEDEPGAGLAALLACRQKLRDDFLLVPTDRVCHPAVFAELIAIGETPHQTVVATATTVAADGGHQSPESGIWRCAPRIFAAIDELRVVASIDNLADLRRELASRGWVETLDARPAWSQAIGSEADAELAEWRLFQDCRKPTDGPIDRHVNRRVSLAISRAIRNWPVSPNMVSVLSLLVAAASGAVCAVHPTYLGFLAGGLLLQGNSILDCVDGELARVRLQASLFGAWLDTVSDHLTSVLFYAGLTVGVRGLPGGRFFMACGIAAVLLQFLMVGLSYPEMIRSGSGSLCLVEPPGENRSRRGMWRQIGQAVGALGRKDCNMFSFMGLAIFGWLPWALPAGAVGILVAVILAARRLVAGRHDNLPVANAAQPAI